MIVSDFKWVLLILFVAVAGFLFVKSCKILSGVNNIIEWCSRKENRLILLGFIIAVIAILIPLILMFIIDTNIISLLNFSSYENVSENMENKLTKLALMGDFLGGTTVGLLSLASIIFVTAAIIMQKEELGLQRNEISETRKVHEINNATMKKQQFDSTFFKVIDLHQKILRDIQYREEAGKDAIKAFMKLIKEEYTSSVINNEIKELKRELAKKNEFQTIFEILYDNYFEKNVPEWYKDSLDKSEKILKKHLDGLIDESECSNQLNLLEEEKKIKKEEHYNEYYNKLKDDENLRNTEISNIDLWEYKDKFKTNLKIKEIFGVLDNPTKDYKMSVFLLFYDDFELYLGHYFRNLYHMIELIYGVDFYLDKKENIKEQNKYISILRAQISSIELTFIFYNVVYSDKKGKKFRELLKGKDFFGEFINEKDLIWDDDKKYLSNHECNNNECNNNKK